jgi:hypothetical protein
MTRSQIVAIVVGIATAFVLILVAAGLLLFQFRSHPVVKSVTAGSSAQKLTPLRFALSNRVEVADSPSLRFGRGPFSISLWFRTTTDRKYIAFIAKRINLMGDGWVLGGDSHNALSFYTAGCASPASQPQSFRDGQWHHLVAVRSGELMTFYFDNQNIGSGPDTCNHNDTNPLKIGMDADGGWNFDGDISEVHLYNRALGPTEIAEEWNNGRGRKVAASGGGLLAGFHFDENEGNKAADFSGNAHDGTLIRSSVAAETNN